MCNSKTKLRIIYIWTVIIAYSNSATFSDCLNSCSESVISTFASCNSNHNHIIETKINNIIHIFKLNKNIRITLYTIGTM